MPIKSDELAFANEQLAGMLKSGLPLEGSLRELAGSMQRGPLRAELMALEKDLARGTHLADALEHRIAPGGVRHVHAAAHVMHVVGEAIVGGAAGDDRLELGWPSRRDLE